MILFLLGLSETMTFPVMVKSVTGARISCASRTMTESFGTSRLLNEPDELLTSVKGCLSVTSALQLTENCPGCTQTRVVGVCSESHQPQNEYM